MTDTTLNSTSRSPIKLSRRAFLGGLGVIAVGSTLFAVRQQQLLALDATVEELIATLQRSTFARYIGDRFDLTLEEVRGNLTLTTVRNLTTPISFATERENRAYEEMSFSVLFSGPLEQPLTQGTYSVQHHRIGAFPLFIVPMQRSADAMLYEATFNRLPV